MPENRHGYRQRDDRARLRGLAEAFRERRHIDIENVAMVAHDHRTVGRDERVQILTQLGHLRPPSTTAAQLVEVLLRCRLIGESSDRQRDRALGIDVSTPVRVIGPPGPDDTLGSDAQARGDLVLHGPLAEHPRRSGRSARRRLRRVRCAPRDDDANEHDRDHPADRRVPSTPHGRQTYRHRPTGRGGGTRGPGAAVRNRRPALKERFSTVDGSSSAR